MLVFEWNALRVGDHVLVHDDDDPGMALHHGVVTLVQVRSGAANDVAIRTTEPTRIVRPRRHAVHMAPLDRTFRCWRCDEMAARHAGHADAA